MNENAKLDSSNNETEVTDGPYRIRAAEFEDKMACVLKCYYDSLKPSLKEILEKNGTEWWMRTKLRDIYRKDFNLEAK